MVMNTITLASMLKQILIYIVIFNQVTLHNTSDKIP